jgi:CRP-like cAMP-binding protein
MSYALHPDGGIDLASEFVMFDQMSTNPWFRALPLTDQLAMLSRGERVALRLGEALFHQGREQPGFFGLVSGALKISTLREDGREAILAVIEPGNWFGEVSMIEGSPRSHYVAALQPSQLLLIAPLLFEELMQKREFSKAISSMLASRVTRLYSALEDAILRSTRAQVARRLLRLAEGDVSSIAATRTKICVSHEDFSMMLGITRQTLAKELKALISAGAIVQGYGWIDIVSIDALKQIAESL